MKTDKEFVLEAIDRVCQELADASDELRKDRKIVMEAIIETG